MQPDSDSSNERVYGDLAVDETRERAKAMLHALSTFVAGKEVTHDGKPIRGCLLSFITDDGLQWLCYQFSNLAVQTLAEQLAMKMLANAGISKEQAVKAAYNHVIGGCESCQD